ncbi:MAG: redox-regulated ATPase YchF [Candidatus Taylorbacteria bacterium]|nr:redox-regulated ATPase YchF [Candidatus Taylorbacteria bacterium]
MSLSIGIVGLPNVGKSTLFKALTNKQVDIQNYPFTTIDPNVGVVEVPDQRVDALAMMSNSKKKIYATVEFIDIAGLVKGAAQGEGLGNKFLANIREVDAIAQVVRAFEDKNITHVHNRIDPAEDIEIINAELILADLETVQKRIEKTSKEIKTGKKETMKELSILEKFRKNLGAEVMIYHNSATSEETVLAKELNLLTAKKFIYVINVSEEQLIKKWTPNEKLKRVIGDSPFVVMNNKLELTLSETSTAERMEYLQEFGLLESGLDNLIKTGYRTLNLLTFLTTGEDETRAWTAHIGDTIPKASRAIHTDFEKLFIRAEVVNWKTLLEDDSYAQARTKGHIRTVGRDYIIQEGDVVEILIGK